MDVKGSLGLTGNIAEKILEKVNITCNKNTIPFDKEKPFVTSGIRLGSPAVTTRGFKEKEMIIVAGFIDEALKSHQSKNKLMELKEKVLLLLKDFPLPY